MDGRLTDRQRFLLVSSLRQRAVLEANTHYGGNLACGIAGELGALADQLDAVQTPAAPPSPVAEDLSWLG